MSHDTTALIGELEIHQGADYRQEFDVTDGAGDPIDLTSYDLRVFELWTKRDPSATIEAVGTVEIVGAPTAGKIALVILHDLTKLMTATSGQYTVHLEDTATAGSRIMAMGSSYALILSTITGI